MKTRYCSPLTASKWHGFGGRRNHRRQHQSTTATIARRIVVDDAMTPMDVDGAPLVAIAHGRQWNPSGVMEKAQVDCPKLQRCHCRCQLTHFPSPSQIVDVVPVAAQMDTQTNFCVAHLECLK